MHPILEEMHRAKELRSMDVLRRWTRDLNALLDEKDAEIARLSAEVLTLTAKKGRAA